MKVYIIFIYILTFRWHILGILCMWTTHKNYFNSLKLNFLLFYKTKIQFIKKSLLYSFYLSLPRPSLISFSYFLISTLLSFSENHLNLFRLTTSKIRDIDLSLIALSIALYSYYLIFFLTELSTIIMKSIFFYLILIELIDLYIFYLYQFYIGLIKFLSFL